MRDFDIQRWSREVARDPGAPSFVRLARAYRRQGRTTAARDVVVRGLEQNPEHLEAHSLLALIHVDEGDRVRARDEWETVLRLEPGHFNANRGLGFLALERDELEAARRHLHAAVRARPEDPTVAQALEIVRQRTATAMPGQRTARSGDAGPEARSGQDPTRLFESLAGETSFLGALVVDRQGLLIAGSLLEARGTGELLAGMLSVVVDEARRTASLVRLGAWEGLAVECDQATLHGSPLPGGALLLLAARPGAPAGWVAGVSVRARTLARRFLEVAP
jgi:tetratricopeptide (TPR) repeat protein